MFGGNPARAQELGDGQTLWVQEVFRTLQGEGPHTGRPALFIRLAGCNLRCFWCDTDFESSTWTPSLSELLKRVHELSDPRSNLIVLTGGEPMRQNIAPLVESLLADGYHVQIETNGTLWIELPESDRLDIVCSPKTSQIHPRIKQRARYFKYVVTADGASPVDGLPAQSTQTKGAACAIARPPETAEVFIMPLDEMNSNRNAENLDTCVQVATRHGYSLTVQLQKIAGFK